MTESLSASMFSHDSSGTLKLRSRAVRSQPLTRESLNEHAKNLAKSHNSIVSGRRSRELYRNFADNCHKIDTAHRLLGEAVNRKDPLTPGAEWLLDNYHIVQQQVNDIKKHFPRSYDKTLPKLAGGSYSGYPQVYHLALEFLSCTDSVIDLSALNAFVSGYQEGKILTMGEIWAVPIMLRFALIEHLSLLATRFVSVRDERQEAEQFVDELLGDDTKQGTEILLVLADKLGHRPDFLSSAAPYLIRRLRERGRKAVLALHWLEEKIREEGAEPEEVLRNEQFILASDQISIGNIINSFRTANHIAWDSWFESVSKVEAILRQDPAKVYSQSDFLTRDRYRHVIERVSKRSGNSEVAVADIVCKLASEELAKGPLPEILKLSSDLPADIIARAKRSHIGYYLIGEGRWLFDKRAGYRSALPQILSRFVRTYPFPVYAGGIVTLTVLIVAALLIYLGSLGVGIALSLVAAVALIIPTLDIATNFVQWLITGLIPPDFLPKLDFRKGIPESAKTVVVVQTMFNDKESARKAVEALEVRYLANIDEQVTFGLLADLADAAVEELPTDREIMEHAKSLIEDLKARHGHDRFFILFRKRLWNEKQGKFMAWERKRGKVEEFNRLLLGKGGTTFLLQPGEEEKFRGFRFVVTLDADSQLPLGVVRKLVGVIQHPLNVAEIDEKYRVTKSGYGIIQPRMGVNIVSANHSRFAEIFSGHAGLDPYTQTISEVYQDLFREGSYIGKGIYDLNAFARTLEGRVPENALLSHDLFEGLFARVALATDIELYDDFPGRYHVHARRQHRWVRGDWQLLAWTLALIPNAKGKWYRSPLSNLGRWKLLDNLRRSLVAPAAFLLLNLAILVLPGSASVWAVFFLLVICFPVYTNIAQAFMIPARQVTLVTHVRGISRSFVLMFKQALFTFSFLPHQAYLMLDAIVRTIYRVFIARRNLLEWETAAHSEKRLAHSLGGYFREMSGGLFLAAASLVLTAFLEPATITTLLPMYVLWLSSPYLAKILSDPTPQYERALSASEQLYLREVAWRTWRYFRELIEPSNNFLIPDNIQLAPSRVVAKRTSPTNISLSMLSTVSAYDMGFLSLPLVVDKLQHMMVSLSRLERFRGHFLNWYSTDRLEPLLPRYVSTVDSGNMVGHLIAIRSALKEFRRQPLLKQEHLQHLKLLFAQIRLLLTKSRLSLPDELTLLTEVIQGAESKSNVVTWRKVLPELLKLEQALSHTQVEAVRKEIGRETVRELDALRRDLTDLTVVLSLLPDTLAPDMPIPSFEELAAPHGGGLVAEELRNRACEFIQEIEFLDREIEEIISEVDFKFLYDEERNLFSIGYHVDNARRDSSFYDLLASEARLTSYVAVAMGIVPEQHWFTLGRPLTESLGGTTLLSWSGTMFEFMMPLLVMKDFPDTILSRSLRSVVRAHRLYADRRGVPWGISESGYSGVDFEATYQYYAFGVPGLGLKRGLEDDLVISPYSTFLAMQISPHEALDNLHELEEEGARGEFGFFEAIDYTAARLRSDEKHHIVQNFLAHHQGMSLVAMNNVLNNGIIQERFHRDPVVRSAELIMQERFPDRPPLVETEEAMFYSLEEEQEHSTAITTLTVNTPHTRHPVTHCLGNGSYSIMLDNAGSGYSLLDREIAVTRWKEDSLCPELGQYIYVKDVENGEIWSATYHPTAVEPAHYEVVFGPDKVEYRRRDHDIMLHLQVTVSPEDNVEIRRCNITNFSSTKRILELTSYGEVVLTSPRADSSHPAFAKMFVQSEFLTDYDCLWFARRPRSVHDKPTYGFHMVSMKTVWDRTQFESSRMEFIGRGRSIRNPKAMEEDLSGIVGDVLDPIFAVRVRVEIEPGETQSVNFLTGIGRDKDELLGAVSRYRDTFQISSAFELAWSQSSVELRQEQMGGQFAGVYQLLGSLLLFPREQFRAKAETLQKNKLSQTGLWRFGISGDVPICLVRVAEQDQVKLIEELLRAHHYLRMRGFVFDLVILNEYPGGYMQNLQDEIGYLIRSSHSGYLLDKKGGVFVRSLTQISEDERVLLETVARVTLSGLGGSLMQQLKLDEGGYSPIAAKPQLPTGIRSVSLPPGAEMRNGCGGFIEDGQAYALTVDSEHLPPMPWSNVIADPDFGFLVTELGGGYTWAGNSREFRLTPWSNDPVSDPPGEVVYARDPDSGQFWSLTPRPVDTGSAFLVEHHLGFSRFSTEIAGIRSQMELSLIPGAHTKWWDIELTNRSSQVRELELYLYVDWILGVSHEETWRFIGTNLDPESKCLVARNCYSQDFSQKLAFIGSTLPLNGFTTHREEFLGRNRSLADPQFFSRLGEKVRVRSVFRGGADLTARQGFGLESCGLIRVSVTVKPGQSQRIGFFLGCANNLQELRERVKGFGAIASPPSRLSAEQYHSVTDKLSVSTPDRSFDLLMNGWLLYQTLSCRLYGRTGFYQSGGAYGFRDQLQDVLPLLPFKPEIVRDQLLLHASRQFPQGDVQHWWHPPTGKGVRTKISDDFLWMPFVAARYIASTGDYGILDIEVPFIEAPLLGEHEHEVYLVPNPSAEKATFLEHCIRAVERGMPLGAHGLPLMGCGDWNDGMNEVGKDGKGESVWLAWFQISVINEFLPLLKVKNRFDLVEKFQTHVDTLKRSIEEHAWDGAWYRRAFFDDGTPLGSASNDECQIDSISQTWGIISGAAMEERAKLGMKAISERLVDREAGIIRLLHPAFDQGSLQPGYIKGYLPGIRENGGQYTHAAVWVIIASALLGEGDRAIEYFNLINPVNRTADKERLARYKGEPYVLCGDVYGVSPHEGRAGWSWYTGSSGWLFQAGFHAILGVKLLPDGFSLDPCVPESWREFSFSYTRGGTTFNIKVSNHSAVSTGVKSLRVQGSQLSENKIRYDDYSSMSQVDVLLEMGI